MNIEEKFNKFYNKFLADNKYTFDELEIQRKTAINERKTNKMLIYIVEILILFILIFSVIVFGLDEDSESKYSLFFLIAFAFPMIIALKRRKKLEEYEDMYQEKIINNIIKYFSPYLKYYPDETIGYEDYKKMAPENFNEFQSSNIIKGTYENSEILISKIITKYTYTYTDYNGLLEPSYKRSSSRETFEGIFIKVSLLENKINNLYLKNKKHFNKHLFNNYLNTIEETSHNYTQLDISELNNLFNIYSSNSNYDINILDSEMNSILVDIYNKHNFEFVIKNNYLYIKFWINGLFSNPPLEKETYDKEIIFKNYRILYIIFYLISKLKEKI